MPRAIYFLAAMMTMVGVSLVLCLNHLHTDLQAITTALLAVSTPASVTVHNPIP